MVDEGSWAKPQLGTPFSGGVHDAEVVLTGPKQVFILFTQLCNAAHQQLQLLILLPSTGRHNLGPIGLHGVAGAGQNGEATLRQEGAEVAENLREEWGRAGR